MGIVSQLSDQLTQSLASAPLPSWAADVPVQLRKATALGLSSARSSLYLAESLPLLAIERAFHGRGSGDAPPAALQQVVLRELRTLIERDTDQIARGVYPLSSLGLESPIEHGLRYLRVLGDAVRVSLRRRAGEAETFEGAAEEWLDDLPRYYRRNFHYQTDGYLSEYSAELYEHQVEILFRGVADAMRRLVVPPLLEAFGRRRNRKLRLLELGTGCGTATRFVADAFPEASITCIDLSAPYLRKARTRLAGRDRVEFARGDATALDYRDECFDGVYSVFLFHELPLKERRRALAETYRVLKSGGVQVLVDSLQRGDIAELDWALARFPEQFHEPFFVNYSRNPMEALVERAGFEAPSVATGFLSKVVSARR